MGTPFTGYRFRRSEADPSLKSFSGLRVFLCRADFWAAVFLTRFGQENESKDLYLLWPTHGGAARDTIAQSELVRFVLQPGGWVK